MVNKNTRKKKIGYKKHTHQSKKTFKMFQKFYMSDFIKPYNGYKNTTINQSLYNDLIIQTKLFQKYETFYIFLRNYFNKLCKTKICKDKWIKCKKDCFETAHELVKEEITSTPYILNLIGNSFLSIRKNSKLHIHYDNQPLTGIWENDKNHFKLSKNQFDKGKLIMGFGPSASGKTYWAKSIIKMLSSDTNLNFPTDFLSIDGGIQRESSIVYQIIKNIIKQLEGYGIKNLVSTSFMKKSIFKSDTIKDLLKDFLFIQNKNNIYPNLYVPETLGGCVNPLKTCSKKYKHYIDITQDKDWVGIYIWQHKDKCHLPKQFQCKTVTSSGKHRQLDEGKKYSSNAYLTSELFGTHELFRTDGSVPPNSVKIRIHNTGGQYTLQGNKKVFNKSIVELDDNLYKRFLDKKTQIESEFNCIIIPINHNYEYKHPTNYKQLQLGGEETDENDTIST
tara:strand:- start:4259 stop:5602 length:1344 start_codon:yes stop_codon:yes gene_type:complete